ncbi:hypothetical protein MferCBS31731_001031 [Microsporum ferrugineum]
MPSYSDWLFNQGISFTLKATIHFNFTRVNISRIFYIFKFVTDRSPQSEVMPDSRDFVTFPETKGEWATKASEYDLKDASIHSKICDSASKISEEQYLLLRSFWVLRSKDKPENLGIKTLSKASRWLEKFDDWQQYLQNLSSQVTAPVPNLGSFSYVFLARCQVTRLPEEYDAEEEDKNVNFSPIAHRLRSSDNKPIPDDYRQSPAKLAGEKRGVDQTLDKNKFIEAMKKVASGKVGGNDSSSGDTKGKEKAEDALPEEFGNLQIREGSLEFLAGSSWSSSSEEPQGQGNSPYGMSPNSLRKAFPKVEDEQIVNGFLIAFLATLCMHHPEVKLEWSPVRKAFKFGKVDNPAGGERSFLFEARTDGHLCQPILKKTDVQSAMIVEVKPTLRAYSNRVIYQATAQMAAWIYKEPDESTSQGPYRRAMILQERQEIRLIIAKYDRSYINYLRNEEEAGAKRSLLEMHQSQAWDISDAKHMREFGNILLALVLQGGKLLD